MSRSLATSMWSDAQRFQWQGAQVSKVMPVDADGKVARGADCLKWLETATGEEKTSGEKLAEQIFQASDL